jgi:hypothetical protein
LKLSLLVVVAFAVPVALTLAVMEPRVTGEVCTSAAVDAGWIRW